MCLLVVNSPSSDSRLKQGQTQMAANTQYWLNPMHSLTWLDGKPSPAVHSEAEHCSSVPAVLVGIQPVPQGVLCCVYTYTRVLHSPYLSTAAPTVSGMVQLTQPAVDAATEQWPWTALTGNWCSKPISSNKPSSIAGAWRLSAPRELSHSTSAHAAILFSLILLLNFNLFSVHIHR